MPDQRVVAAFAAIPREDFVGPGPWRVFTTAGYLRTPSNDPAFLYQDITVGLQNHGFINNGQPSLHAKCLSTLRIEPGEHVVHIGAGAGYYTALLAHLVGPAGSVTAYEIDAELAQRAAANLAKYPQVVVHQRSGSLAPIPSCNVIYVNAGATDPLDIWLDALQSGGRLLLPLTSEQFTGGMLLVTRSGESFAARFISPAAFIPCSGARNSESGTRIAAAFKQGAMDTVKALHRNNAPDETSWCHGRGWWLSTKPAMQP